MRYAKRVISRSRSHRELCYSPETLNRDYELLLHHMRPSPDGLRSGGAFEEAYREEYDIGKVFCSGDRVFVYFPAEQMLRDIGRGANARSVPTPNYFTPSDTLAASGEAYWFFYDDRIGYFGEYGYVAKHFFEHGGPGVFFKDRLCFVADGTFHYSADHTDFTLSDEQMPNRYGHVNIFRPECGKPIAVAPLNDKLYLIRERGIDEYTVRHETYAHEAHPVPYSGEEIVPDTVGWTERNILFLTGAGLCSFDGKKTELVDGRAVKELTLPERPECRMWGDIYCLYGTGKDGKRTVYGYDCAAGIPFFLEADGVSLAASRALYVAKGNAVYRLTGEGFPAGGSSLSCTFSFDEGIFLEGISFEGSGSAVFTLTTESEEREVSVLAEEVCPLHRPMRARKLTVRARFFEEGFVFRSLVLKTAKEKV